MAGPAQDWHGRRRRSGGSVGACLGRPPRPVRTSRRTNEPRGRVGQALVEFALVLPALLLLTLGVVDVARTATAYVSLANAAREAVLFASAGGGAMDEPRILSRLRIDAQAGGLTWALVAPVTIECTGSTLPTFAPAAPCSETSTFVRITVGYQLGLITPLPGVSLVRMSVSATSPTVQ